MIIAFLLAALGFIVSLAWHPYSFSWLVKIVPIFILFLLLVKRRYNQASFLILFGLLFSAGGDIALDVDRKKLFVAGLGLFLVAHLFYLAAFLRYREKFNPARHLPRLLFVVAYATIMIILLWPNLGKLQVPVLLYIIAIGLMTMAAALQPGSTTFAGALIFMASDSMIAISKFLGSFALAGVLIIITYYLAQCLIVTGHLQSRPKI